MISNHTVIIFLVLFSCCLQNISFASQTDSQTNFIATVNGLLLLKNPIFDKASSDFIDNQIGNKEKTDSMISSTQESNVEIYKFTGPNGQAIFHGEKSKVATTRTMLIKNNQEFVYSKIITNLGDTIELMFSVNDLSIFNETAKQLLNDKHISIGVTQSSLSFFANLPKQMMQLWSTSDVTIKINGHSYFSEPVIVSDDPLIGWDFSPIEVFLGQEQCLVDLIGWPASEGINYIDHVLWVFEGDGAESDWTYWKNNYVETDQNGFGPNIVKYKSRVCHTFKKLGTFDVTLYYVKNYEQVDWYPFLKKIRVVSPPYIFYNGLTWQQSDDGQKKSWSKAFDYCNNLGIGGFNDWRVPTGDELRGLVVCTNGHPTPLDIYGKCDDDGYSSSYRIPTIDTAFSSQSNVYWSSTDTYSPFNDCVDFSSGFSAICKTTDGSHYVRCVR